MDSGTDAITIGCRLRRSTDDVGEGNLNRGKEMLCEMHYGTLQTDWNLWDGVTIKHSHSLDGDNANETSQPGLQGERRYHVDETKLSFVPVERPPSVSTSRTRHTVPSPRRIRITKETTLSSSNDEFEFNLPNPNLIAVPRRMHCPNKSVSPDRRLKAKYRAHARRPGDCANAAAACFEVTESISKSQPSSQSQPDPLDISASDLVSVEKDSTSNQNCGIGVIRIKTRSLGILEIMPYSKDERDVLISFLRTCLPKVNIKDKFFKFTQQMQCATSDDISVDIQNFEASAVRKSLANESFFEKIRRNGAIVSLRMQELCLCCETQINVNEKGQQYELVKQHGANSILDKDDMDTSVTGNSTVESVLSEMELSEGPSNSKDASEADDSFKKPKAISIVKYCTESDEKISIKYSTDSDVCLLGSENNDLVIDDGVNELQITKVATI